MPAFKPGDHVFYPKGGVFVIESETEKVVGGYKIECLELVSSDSKTKISIPKGNMVRVGVRSLLSKKELQEAMDSWIPDLKLSRLHHKNRKSKFEILRQTGNFFDMGTVVTTIHHLIHTTKATFEEKRMYDQIRKRLADEISIVKEIDAEEADIHLGQMLDKAITRKPKKSAKKEDEIDSEMISEEIKEEALV